MIAHASNNNLNPIGQFQTEGYMLQNQIKTNEKNYSSRIIIATVLFAILTALVVFGTTKEKFKKFVNANQQNTSSFKYDRNIFMFVSQIIIFILCNRMSRVKCDEKNIIA